MSRAPAEFHFFDGTILHGVYEGTSDIMDERMYRTAQEEPFDHRPCTHKEESCIAVSHYGNGFWWWGKACRVCMRFLGPRGLDTVAHINDFLPEWVVTK